MRVNEGKRMRLRQKFCEIRTKFPRYSYEFRANFTFPEYSHKLIHVKFARNSYEFRTNFVRIYVNFFKLHANHGRDPQNLLVCGRGMVETLPWMPCPFHRSCTSDHAAAQGAIRFVSGSYTTEAPTRAPASCYQAACSTLHRQVRARHGVNSAYPRKKSCSHRPA